MTRNPPTDLQDNPNTITVDVNNYLAELETLRAERRTIASVEVLRGGYRLRLRPRRLVQPDLADMK